MNLVERVPYKASLIVTGCWHGTSRERLYEELGWESLSHSRWLRRLTVFYKFPKCLAPIKAWINLDEEGKSKSSVQSFKTYIMKTYIRTSGHSFFGISDKHGIRFLIKIIVSFSDLRDHRFSHNFTCVSPVCNCGIGDETTVHYMLRCPLFIFERIPFLDRISDVIHSDVTVLSYTTVAMCINLLPTN